jgi:hypothetical protein
MTRIICENQKVTFDDGLIWKLSLTATAGVGTWNIKAALTRDGSVKVRHGRWSARTGWNPSLWRPLPGSEIAQNAEEWMRANPVPISDGVAVRRGMP